MEHLLQNMTHSELRGAREVLCNIIDRIQSARTLTTLVSLHNEAEVFGFVNDNLRPDPYGIYRAEPGINGPGVDNIFLGNVNGVWTHNVETMENLVESGRYSRDSYEYKSDLSQYRNFLLWNYYAVRKEIDSHLESVRKEPKTVIGRLFYRGKLHPKNQRSDGSDDVKRFFDNLGVYPSDMNSYRNGLGKALASAYSKSTGEAVTAAYNYRQTRRFVTSKHGEAKGNFVKRHL